MKIINTFWTSASLALLGVLVSAGPAAADALQFNGINQSVQVPDSASLRLTNRITVEACRPSRRARARNDRPSSV